MGPPSYPEQGTGVYDGLTMRREGRARADIRRPARQAPPHQWRNPVRDALWEWKPMQHIPHIVGYVVKLPEPANKSSRRPVDPPQLLHPNPRETSEDGTAIIKSAEQNQSESSFIYDIIKYHSCHRRNCDLQNKSKSIT